MNNKGGYTESIMGKKQIRNLKYKKKKNSSNGKIKFSIFLSIIVTVGILFSGGSIGRFITAFTIEMVCAVAFWFLANYLKNENKIKSRHINNKADLMEHQGATELIKKKSNVSKATSSLSKLNNRNFDWVIKKEEVEEAASKIEEKPDIPQRDIKAEVANWSKLVHYSASVFDNIMQKSNQQIQNNEDDFAEEKKGSAAEEEIYTEKSGKSVELPSDCARGSISIDMYVETPGEVDTHLENETVELVLSSSCYDMCGELSYQNDEYLESTPELNYSGERYIYSEDVDEQAPVEIEEFSVESQISFDIPGNSKKLIAKGCYKSNHRLRKKLKILEVDEVIDSQHVDGLANCTKSEAMPPIELLRESSTVLKIRSDYNPEDNAIKLINTLASFGVGAKIINISEGPAVTRYEVQPDYGVKVSKIVNLTDDIALNLAATGVRIEAPIPGKAAIGIEIPNREVTPVLLRDVIESGEFVNHPSKLAFAVGKDIAGNAVVADIAKMPHLLIAGATGSGKSVCINTLITSILYKATSSEVKLLMVDPKVVELSIYNGIPHLLIPVVTDPKKAAGALNWAVQEMTNRYKLFADNNVRDLKGYNLLIKEKEDGSALPQIVIIVDELADLMMVAPNDVEDCICRLAQMARAAGMHLVIATQRPSVDVITGVIKANIPSRISFAVSSQIDSRTILDMAGAEKLLGRGDMLFNPIGMPKPVRVQGGLITDKEVETIVSYIKSGEVSKYDENIIEKIERQSESSQANLDDDDELLPQVVNMVIEQGQASTSLIQRKFKIGYSRAARILDQLESCGIVGPFEGSKPRKILVTKQQWLEMV